MFLIVFQTDKLCVFISCYNTNGLIWVKNEEFRLFIEVCKIVKLSFRLFHEVVLNNLISSCKDKTFTLIKVKVDTFTNGCKF